MICPDCGHDNIDGVDNCAMCDQPLTRVAPVGNELEESIARHPVSVLVPKQPVSVASTASVRDTVSELVQRKIGCLLVVDDSELVGIFTERDLLYKVTEDIGQLDQPVSQFMTTALETITAQDSIAYALHLMDLGGYRHLPIVDDDGKATGIISVRDILRFLCVRFAELRSHAS